MTAENSPTPNTLNKLVKNDLSLLSEVLDEHYVVSDDPFIDDHLENDSLRGKMMAQVIEALAIFAGATTEDHRQLAHRAAHFAATVAGLELWRLDEERYTATYLRDIMVELAPFGMLDIAIKIASDTDTYMKQNPELDVLTSSYAPCLASEEHEVQLCRSVMQTMFMMIDIDMTRRRAEDEAVADMQRELHEWNGYLDEGSL